MRILHATLLAALGGTLADAQPTAPRVAVMNFSVHDMKRDTSSALLEWSLAELLANRLGNLQAVTVRDRRLTQNVLTGTSASASGRSGTTSSASPMPVQGVQSLVTGIASVLGDLTRVDVTLIDMQTGTVMTRVSGGMTPTEDLRTVLDSLAARISQAATSPNGVVATGSARNAPPPASGMSGASGANGQSRLDLSSAGLRTVGRALRLAASSAGSQEQAIAMLRAAAVETPALSADVEQIVKRWTAGPP